MTKVLIIEDESIIRENLKELLEIYNYYVIDAEDGVIGVKRAYEEKPDIILCDINMPNLNGFDVLKKLQSNPETFAIPFLFLTAFSEKENFREGMRLGADDYITKPYQKDDVINAIETRIKKSYSLAVKSNEKIEALRKSISMSIPHELRTPLNSILGFSQILKEYHKELSDEELTSMFSNIYDSGHRLLRIIDNYIFYNKVISRNNDKDIEQDFEYDLKHLIEQVLHVCGRHYENVNIKSSISNYACTLKNEYLEKIIFESIDNACKFAKDNSAIEVVGKIHNDKYYISIKNQTNYRVDFNKDDIGAFVQFNRDKYEQQGAGMGLAIIKAICILLDIEFEIDCDDEFFLLTFLI